MEGKSRVKDEGLREKAIKGLECLAQKCEPTANPCKDCGYISRPNFAICVKDVAADALEVLESKPVKTFEDYGEIKFGFCPGCGALINDIYYPKSCGCGQAVKWDE